MEFFDWGMLGTFAGATFAVAIVTQLTKGVPVISKIPTQIWSYILAAVILVSAHAFTVGLSSSVIALALINAAMVSIAANGGYAAITRIKEGIDNGGE